MTATESPRLSSSYLGTCKWRIGSSSVQAQPAQAQGREPRLLARLKHSCGMHPKYLQTRKSLTTSTLLSAFDRDQRLSSSAAVFSPACRNGHRNSQNTEQGICASTVALQFTSSGPVDALYVSIRARQSLQPALEPLHLLQPRMPAFSLSLTVAYSPIQGHFVPYRRLALGEPFALAFASAFALAFALGER